MRLKYTFLVLILLNLTALRAQTGGNDQLQPSTKNYDVKQYNSENGLPQNSATDLLLDQNNFLWIATQNGLVRFDGQRFRVYNRSNTPALKIDRFSVISETLQHQVLFKSSYADAEIYMATPDYKIRIDSAAMHLPHKLISIHSNGIFDGSSLFAYYAKNNTPVFNTPFLDTLFNSDAYWVLNEQEAVIQYGNDYYYLNNLTTVVFKLAVKWKPAEAPSKFFIGDLFCIARDNGEVLFFKNGKQTIISVDKSVTELLKGYASLPIAQFSISAKGSQLIIRRHNDFYQLSIEGNRLTATSIFKDLSFLENQPVYSIQYDKRSQRIFLGTQNAGLFIVTNNMFKTLEFKPADYSNNIFMAFSLLPDGKILTTNGILGKGEGSRSFLFSNGDRLDRNCLYKAEDGSIWYSKQKQLYKSDSAFSRKSAVDSLELESYITDIAEHDNHVFWISTVSSLLKMEEGKLRYVLYRYPPFINHSIESIMEVSPGTLWIATRNGLYEYDITAGKIKAKPILPDIYVRSIFKAKDNSLWLGTYGSGYFKYENLHFRPLPLDPEKNLSTVHTFLEDDKGFFWISTNHGLFKIRKRDLDSASGTDSKGLFYYYFDKSYGFNTNEFNGGCHPAALKGKDGNFFFPSLNGIVYFNPDSCRLELPDKAIFIDHFLVDSFNLDYRQAVGIKPDFNRIVVGISTPFYGLEENLRIEYKLNPIGDKWYPVNRDGKIIINRLPYGKYTLSIRKVNGWGHEDYSYSNISFEVLPDWYDTWLFYLLLLAVAIGFAFLIVKLRTRILSRQNTHLQVKVDERTFELEQSTLLKERLISVIMHDLTSPLLSQSFIIDYLYRNHARLGKAELDDLFFQLKDSSKRISQFSADFLTWYNSQKEIFLIKKEKIELSTFIETITVFYKEIAVRKGLSFEHEIPDGLILISDEHILAIIIRNLVDNAVKYTRSGSIRIAVYEKDSNIYIRVSDTGPGIPPAKIKELLSHLKMELNNMNLTFGYRFIVEFTEKLGGTLNIESETGVGTHVTFSLGIKAFQLV